MCLWGADEKALPTLDDACNTTALRQGAHPTTGQSLPMQDLQRDSPDQEAPRQNGATCNGGQASAIKRKRAHGESSTQQSSGPTGRSSGSVHAGGVRTNLKWLSELRKEYDIVVGWPCRWKQRKRFHSQDATSQRKNCKDTTTNNLEKLCACCNRPAAGGQGEAGPAPISTGGGEARPAPNGALKPPAAAPSGPDMKAEKRKGAPSGAPQERKRRTRADTKRREDAAARGMVCEVVIAPLEFSAPPARGTCAGDGGGVTGTSAGGRKNKKGVG